MDGVIYSGAKKIDGTNKFIKNLQDNSIPFLFLTNNSQRTQRETQLKLKNMDIHVDEENIYTSAMATANFLARQKPKGTAYVIGEGGLIQSLYNHGFSISDVNPDYVVVGEGVSYTLDQISSAIDMILDGSKLIATNLDPSPKIVGWTKPGIKATVAMLEEATGVKAFSVGKPSPVMMREARKKLDTRTAETVIIGDTLGTDILGGVQMGYTCIMTLTGVSKLSDLKKSAFEPHIIIESIAEL
ncbi:UNVERIFIED_CONTAM: hypothetical protein GTU68_029386, partial [Idotea baltica]|nr:hypothetical protein [Idotea baltica]